MATTRVFPPSEETPSLNATLQGEAMAEEIARVRIQLLDGRHLEAQGSLESVAAKLAPDACGHHGFCEITDPRGSSVLVNRDHVMYLERRGPTRTLGR
jgi:hypothetical protein